MATGAGYGVAEGLLPNPFRTPGVQNIENRYSAGGGSKNHLPGAGTKRGDPDQVVGNTETDKGIGSPHHEAHYQGQKPDVSAQRVFGTLGSSCIGELLSELLLILSRGQGFATCADIYAGACSRVDSIRHGIERSTILIRESRMRLVSC